MIRGIMGKKIGMTQIFDTEGNITPVTVVEAGPCTVLGLKDKPLSTTQRGGSANFCGGKVILGYGEVKETRLNGVLIADLIWRMTWLRLCQPPIT